ncbi:MAG: hypothetical protein F4X47_05565 [Gammaproteobacteria bacterium]|nr:hypothetical protein [Gammaproteobacteria bacterium]MYC51769.1 hypothetical protein [Gammaproteobacteria bacterium]
MLGIVRRIVREEIDTALDPVHDQLDDIEGKIDGMWDALIFMSEHFPGTVPGVESHIAKGVKKRLVKVKKGAPTSQSL